MACTGARTIDMPALERPFQLGMLYDCRSNTFIPGITLWDSKTLKRNTETMPKHSTTNQIITSDTMADKASALSLSGSLKASVLAGLVELGGSAAFFNDIKKSKHHARVTLQYSMTDRFEHLTMSQLGPESISYPAVFGDHTATHVVTAVLYGAQAFFVFDREVSSSENMWEIEGKMKLLVEKIPKVPGGEETSGRFQKKQESNENLYCTFYGDFCLKKNPLSYQDAMQVYAKLPDLLRSDEKQTVPVRVWLCPLSMLDPRAAQLVREIRSVLITDAERALEHLAECDVRCSDMERVKAATTFPEIQRKIREFRNLCKQCRQMFQEELASSLPAIHGGQEEEGALVKILTSMEQSPFSTNQLSEFLEKKQEEMNFIHSYLAVLEGVRVVSSQSELQAAVLGPRHRFVVSLTLTSLHTEEPYFSALNLWLRRPFMEKTSGVVSGSLPGKNPKSKQWFEDKEIRRKAQQVVKSFSDFVRVNKSNRAVLFLVASVPDKDNPGASIYLYEDGELVSTNFEPPAKPLPPLIAGISHDRVQLTLKPAPFGESVIMGYKVEYRDFGLGGWMTRNINSKQETFPVSQLYANTRYQFRYTAVTKPGLSASSEESDVVKTLPTSPPGTPAAATVESTAITLSWEAPAVIGQRVSVKEYRVQYREEVGGENPAEKDKWLEQRTGQKVELCKTDGLKPQMLYRVRVSAVCEDGALSAPSEDLCISTLPVWANLPVTSMADVEREAVEMPTLGRPFQLGMLYDCRTDAPLPDVTLLDTEVLHKDVDIGEQCETEWQVLVSDTIEDKASMLRMGPALQTSFLCGLVEVKGSAAYLNDTTRSQRQARVTLRHQTSTRLERLTMSHLGLQQVPYPAVPDQGKATHVVTAVLYGAQAFFVFDQEVGSREVVPETQGNMKRLIEKLRQISAGQDGEVEVDDSEKEEAQHIRCTYYGDFALKDNPATYQDATRVCATLPKLVGDGGEKAVPLRVWLYPLSRADARGAAVVREISARLMAKAQAVLEQLNDCDRRCRDMMRDSTALRFPAIQGKLQQCQALCTRYRQAFQKQLAAIVPAIRAGGAEEGCLEEALMSIEQSPFSPQHLREFLDLRMREMKLVNMYLPLLDGVELISSEEDLRDIVFNPMITYVVSFTFTSLHREEPFLSGLVAWLHTADERKTWDPASASPACEESNCRLWFEHDVAQRRARVSARFFSDFVRVNKCSGKTRFLVTSVSDEDNPGASIYLYEDGELVCTNFEPPSKPLPPLIAGISHDCVQLTLKPATRGEAAVTGYRVEYRRVGQEDWTAVSVYSKQETFPVSQLCANTEYQFQYAAISKPGLSVSSVVSDAVRMLPTSPPGRPVAVYVGSSAISLSWEAPAVLGEGVSIKEYRVEYREEAGGESPEQKDKWLERRTGRKAELCDIDGLSPGTPYRLRVSAVCAGGTMSNVSEELTISTAKAGAITSST
ncbi:uncharacterized protein LOC102568112 [Alligator mississippiensis]|uniref:uncharacterized protein LOC102568112 n=1 Tax=Alligator mississippiensis TaxID=8496 RepID=UPI0028772FC1|nr:uncharacterized protein LOC102568112 [Alligator mississippiensis]